MTADEIDERKGMAHVFEGVFSFCSDDGRDRNSKSLDVGAHHAEVDLGAVVIDARDLVDVVGSDSTYLVANLEGRFRGFLRRHAESVSLRRAA
jgi:hypothetical protein